MHQFHDFFRERVPIELIVAAVELLIGLLYGLRGDGPVRQQYVLLVVLLQIPHADIALDPRPVFESAPAQLNLNF